MSKSEPFIVPEIKDFIGWRPNEKDKQHLRLLMADRRETNISKLLRELVGEAAVPVRKRWKDAAARIAAKEDEFSG